MLLKKWFRRIAWLLLAWAGVCAALWLALPWWLKPEIEKQASVALGREVRVDHLVFRPWALAVELRGVRVGGTSPGDQPVLTVDEVEVDADLRSVWERAPVVSAAVVRAPKLRLTRIADGRYDIDDLLEKFSKPSPQPSSEPARFALYNLQLLGGEIEFDDLPVKRNHHVKDVRLTLPFLSNIPTQVDIKVEPRLQFLLNGSAFDSGAQAVPFAKQRHAVIELHLDPTDLTHYAGYAPSHLPVRLKTGELQAKLTLQLDMPVDASPRMQLSGELKTKNIALTDASAAPLLAWQNAAMNLLDIQPLVGLVRLGPMDMDGLIVNLSRQGAGPWNWNFLDQQQPRVAGQAAVPALKTEAAGSKAQNKWQFSLKSVALKDSVLHIGDGAVKPAARLQIRVPEVAVGAWAWPSVAAPGAAAAGSSANLPATDVRAVAGLYSDAGPVGSSDLQGSFRMNGRLLGTEFDGGLEIQDLLLQPLAPYLNQVLQPRLAARVSAKARVKGQAPLEGGDAPVNWSVSQGEVTVSDLRLTAPAAGNKIARAPSAGPTLLAFRELSFTGVAADSSTRRVNLDNVVLSQPKTTLARDKWGVWNAEKWLVQKSAAPTDKKSAIRQAATTTEPPWQLQLAQFQVKGGELDWVDAAAAEKRVVELQARGLQFALRDVVWQDGRLNKPVRVQVDARINDGVHAGDRNSRSLANWAVFSSQATLNVEPLQAKGSIKTERFPVHVFAPYAAKAVPVDLRRADLALTGDFNLAQKPTGLEVQASGQLAVANLEVLDWPDAASQDDETLGTPLISWQRLLLDGVRFRLVPGGKPDIEVAQADLTGLVSRLVITEKGSFNLRDVAAPTADGASPPRVSADVAQVPAATPSASDAAATPKAADGLPLRFVLGGVKVVNATVDFTDRFIRPNYSAKLTELNGSLGAVRSDSRDMAPITLKGRAAGTALLDIAGQVNPMVEPLALDINAKATDLELAPLTAYAGKYAGYAIERGKLSLELQYKIDPSGRLEANNQLILNQLTFGEKVDSPTATKLPVLLAVALLKDRNGVIDINLPVSGSIQDPQFSVGGIIWKIILNLIGKALTAPFSLLAGGGSTDLSVVEFVPGTAVVSEKGQAAISKVGQALLDRPSLRMTVSGAADPTSERDAFAQAAVQAQVVAEQKRELARAGSTPEVLPPLSPEDRAALLRRVYRQTDMPGKPRNALGLIKDIPVPEMESLLQGHVRVSVEAMRELALQRGLAVRQTLADKGVGSDRLFLAAPKLRVSGEDDAAWLPSVQLTLATR
ncbi:MAG: hypothetical protein RIS44_767 [Pseudomonadota bacterium]|jgi:hypothetical protein